MNLYEIEYRDEDPGCPTMCMLRRAEGLEHLQEILLSDPDAGGWIIERVARVDRTIPRHRWVWHNVHWRI